ENPVLTVSYDGFVNGDTEANLTTPATIATTATKASAVGTYPITVSGAVLSNYAINYGTNTALTITPASLIITAENKERQYGVDNPVLTVSYDGFVNGDTEANLTTPATIATTATKASAVGEYEITVDEATSLNYTITFKKGTLTVIKSSNAGLTDLAISNGTLSPAFEEGIKDYTTTVPNDIENITLTAIAADPSATITVNGIEVPSGTPTDKIPLVVGENKITTIVTAQDGTTSTYTVIVTREPSNNAGLIDLAISKGTLSPVFEEGTKEYTATVPNEVADVTLTPVTSDPTAVVTIKGKVIPSGTPTDKIPLEVGENEIVTTVTAQDGTISTYTVIVTREPSHNSGLTDLAISEGTLSPAFAEGTLEYKSIVPNDTTSIKVKPTNTDASATITVNGKEVPSGTPSGEIPLQVGENIITTVVTAQDGTISTYTIIVTREDATPIYDAGLADISLSEGDLSPAFNTDYKDYKVDVPNETNSIVINPVPIDPKAKVEMVVDGVVIDPTAPIDLKVGDNIITVVVTAEDGTQETYTVIVNRAAPTPQAIVPNNFITPNGDGKNDYWIINGLDKYPNNSVKVFDRAARLVYSANNYNNDWDGTFKGSPVNEDTYYYLIDLGNGSPKLKGFISILRN
ncbi:MAG: cadherin-like beta sandwich domain-containing protein, partial [Flavobacterium sp.]